MATKPKKAAKRAPKSTGGPFANLRADAREFYDAYVEWRRAYAYLLNSMAGQSEPDAANASAMLERAAERLDVAQARIAKRLAT